MKAWDDNYNQDGVRPESVTVNLLADGKIKDTAVLTEADGWRYTFSDLDARKDGVAIEYTVSEVLDEDSPYEQGEIEGTASTAFIIPNTYEPETISVTANKVWDDKDDQDGARPEEVTVRLFANGIFKGEETLNEDGDWTCTWEDLPKYNKGVEILYTVAEDAVSGYTAVTTPSADNDGNPVFTITNSYTPGKTSVTVIKNWDDNNDQDGIRPAKITVELLDDLDEGDNKRAELSEFNDWTYTFTGLDEYAGGEKINYTVQEKGADRLEGYDVSYAEVSQGSGIWMITNTHKPELEDVIFTKFWEDEDNQDGVRPTTVTINLFANGLLKKSIMLSEEHMYEDDANTWLYTFEELPKYENGKEIAYVIFEDPVKDYTIERGEDGQMITNIHEPGKKSVTVTKTWEDEDDADGIRPDSVSVQLKADGEDLGDPVTLSEANDWTYVWNVPVYKSGESGTEVVYTVEEPDVPSGYTASYANIGETGELFVVTNTHKVERTDYTIEVQWEDNNNQDGVRPGYVEVYLMKDGEKVAGSERVITAADGWKYTWTGLPAKNYKPSTMLTSTFNAPKLGAPGDPEGEDGGETGDDSGEEGGGESDGDSGEEASDAPAYTADETLPLDNPFYSQKSATHDADARKTTVVNVYEPETVTIGGQKIWEDKSNQDGVRPESTTIYLYADGVFTDFLTLTSAGASKAFLSEEQEALESTDNVWNYEFTGLPKYKNGEVIRYTVSERAVENYTMRVNGFDITNSYTPGKTFVTAIKVWDDNRNSEGLRPDSIVVSLYANGEEVERASISEGTGWYYVFTGLDMYKDGKPIDYRVTEDAVPGYKTPVVEGSATEGYMIINTIAPVTRKSVQVTKKWKDENGQDMTWPSGATVTVELAADGELTGRTVALTKSAPTATFTGLPAGAKYTVVETGILGVDDDDYTPSVIGKETDGYTITNQRNKKEASESPSTEKNNNNSNTNTNNNSSSSKSGGGSSVSTSGSGGGNSVGGNTVSSVKTGDDTPLMLWITILLASLALIAGFTLEYRRKARRSK